LENPTADFMPMDYYSDSEGEGDTQTAAPPDQDRNDQGDDQSVVLPKTALGSKPCSVGDKLTLEVTQVGEDEVLAKVVSSDEEEESTEPSSPMDSMMSDEGEGEGY
jgi:hypothetical protein